MAAFFIKRPVFAWVIAILMMLAGVLALRSLPVAHYPDIALPQIAVTGTYPGASASMTDRSVTQVIERQMKGLDNLLYMRSSSDAFGNVEIFFTFASGTDPDIAQVQVQNKLSQAEPMLPDAVKRQGLQVMKAVDNSFLVVAFYVDDDSMRINDVSDYVSSNLLDSLNRVQGVGSTTLYGGENAMRIWLDPEKMRRYSLNPSDVVSAIEGENAQVAGGQVVPRRPRRGRNSISRSMPPNTSRRSRISKTSSFALKRMARCCAFPMWRASSSTKSFFWAIRLLTNSPAWG